MPNRIVKETIRTSDTLSSVSAEAERLFWRLVVSADDFGRFDGRPGIILGQCLSAFLDVVTTDDVARWLTELRKADLIHLYSHDGRPYLVLTKWDKHQRTRAKDSKFPSPDDPLSHPLSNDSESRSNVVPNVFENENEYGNENGIVNEDEDDSAREPVQGAEQVAAATLEPGESSSQSDLDEGLAQVGRVWQDEKFGQVTPIVAERLKTVVDEFGADWVLLAMKQAVTSGVLKLRYIESMLINWRQEGGPRITAETRVTRNRGRPHLTAIGSGGAARGQRDERYAAFYELFPDA